MKRIKEYPETHQQGTISIENVDMCGFGIDHADHPMMVGDFAIQIAEDGRVWVCINGVAFLRFSPHPNGKMEKG